MGDPPTEYFFAQYNSTTSDTTAWHVVTSFRRKPTTFLEHLLEPFREAVRGYRGED